MKAMRHIYKYILAEPEGKRPGNRWEDNKKGDI
jgi:hypothetical protein